MRSGIYSDAIELINRRDEHSVLELFVRKEIDYFRTRRNN